MSQRAGPASSTSSRHTSRTGRLSLAVAPIDGTSLTLETLKLNYAGIEAT
jgi:hypothetical protein